MISRKIYDPVYRVHVYFIAGCDFKTLKRKVDKYGFGPVADFLLDGFWTILKSVFLVNGHSHRISVHKSNKIGVTGIMRIGDDDLIPPFQQC